MGKHVVLLFERERAPDRRGFIATPCVCATDYFPLLVEAQDRCVSLAREDEIPVEAEPICG